VFDTSAHRLEERQLGRLGADGDAEPAGPIAGLREDHRLLRTEVAEEGRRVDVGVIGDVVHGDGVEPALGEEVERRGRQGRCASRGACALFDRLARLLCSPARQPPT
jgi:hypothetical protein